MMYQLNSNCTSVHWMFLFWLHSSAYSIINVLPVLHENNSGLPTRKGVRWDEGYQPEGPTDPTGRFYPWCLAGLLRCSVASYPGETLPGAFF